MRTVAIVIVGIVAMLLPNVSLGNGARPPKNYPPADTDAKPAKPILRLRAGWDARPLVAVPANKIVRLAENAPVSVTYRNDLDRPRIVIPKKYVSLEGKVGAKADADLPAGRTALAGLTLSVAFVSGGFWLVRRNGNTGKALLLMCAIASTLFVSPLLNELSSNQSAPPKLPAKTSGDLEIGFFRANLGMDIFVVADGDRVEIILPSRLLPVGMVPRDEFNMAPLQGGGFSP